MSHPILSKLERSRSKLLEVVQNLPDETLDQTGEAGSWTIRQILIHLLNAEGDHTQIIGVIARGELDKIPAALDVNTHNEGRVNERGPLTREELFAALSSERTRTISLFDSLTDDQFELSGPHPVLGEMTIDKIFKVLALHDHLHLRDIQAILNVGADST